MTTTIGTTSRPAYVYDAQTDTWIPVGVGPHSHDNYVDKNIIAAKGDLLVGTANDTVSILSVGSNGNLLTADSSTASGVAWLPAPVSLPTQTDQSGKYLTTNGTVASWATVDALPAQTGNAGELLTTNGTAASWSNTLIANATNAVGLIVRGLASQTEDLQEWQNSSGTVLSRIDSSGRFVGDGSQLTGISSDPTPQIFLLMGA
jgi:hypothetical protein